MKALYDMQVGHRISWRDATPGAASLSAPLAALLDTMLQPDPAQRCSLEQVAASEWACLELPKKLEVSVVMCTRQGFRGYEVVLGAVWDGWRLSVEGCHHLLRNVLREQPSSCLPAAY